MTKKYEKFEQWMVGKTVTWDGEEGVVTRGYEGVEKWVWVLWEDQLMSEAWIDVESLEFLNIPCSDTQSQSNDTPIPWEEGQVVWDLLGGKGKVVCVDGQDSYPVRVVFDDGERRSYTAGGELYSSDEARRLFFSEPTIIADTMPPKKPFIPKLKKGDKVFISFGGKARLWFVEVVQEDETTLTFKLEGDEFSSTHFKKDIRVFVCTEEIKWEA